MDEMRKLDVDSKALDEKIKELKALNSQMYGIFNEVKTKVNELQGEWISKTSSEVFTTFEKFNKIIDRMKAERNNDVQFTEKTNENYQSMEKSIDSLVDTHIDL